jgi:hypothetical protein
MDELGWEVGLHLQNPHNTQHGEGMVLRMALMQTNLAEYS